MAESDSDEEAAPFHWMEGDSLAPPCQSEDGVIADILELASPGASDVVYDLGCCDGRICIQATERYGARSCGVEIEEALVARFRRNVEKKGLQDLVRIEHSDLREVDLAPASIVILYLLPEAIEAIRHKLVACLERGAKIVANTWGLNGLQPLQIRKSGPYNNVPLMLYTSASCTTPAAETSALAEKRV